jgi:ATP-dependent protease ClpP protease subunit
MARIRNAESTARLSWRVQNVESREAEIDIFDVIGDPWDGTTAKDFIGELRSLDVDKLRLNINSPGGYVDDALAMYDAILNHPAEVTAHVVSASSAASFVMMAADRREIAKNGKVFIHDAQGVGMGDSSTMRQLADILDEESDNIASIYAERAGGTTAEWRERMQADNFGTTYRGQDAVDIGLIDEVATAPVRNAMPTRIAAQETEPEPPQVDIPLGLIPPLANGYKPPLPDDFTRLVAANLPASKEARNG